MDIIIGERIEDGDKRGEREKVWYARVHEWWFFDKHEWDMNNMNLLSLL